MSEGNVCWLIQTKCKRSFSLFSVLDSIISQFSQLRGRNTPDGNVACYTGLLWIQLINLLKLRHIRKRSNTSAMYESHLWNTSMPRAMTQDCLWLSGSAGLTSRRGSYLSVFVIFVQSVAQQNKIWAWQIYLNNASIISIILVLLQNKKIQQDSTVHLYLYFPHIFFLYFLWKEIIYDSLICKAAELWSITLKHN